MVNIRKEYTGLTLPKPLMNLVGTIVSYDAFGFTSRSEFVKAAIRKELDEKIQEIAILEDLKK